MVLAIWVCCTNYIVGGSLTVFLSKKGKCLAREGFLVSLERNGIKSWNFISLTKSREKWLQGQVNNFVRISSDGCKSSMSNASVTWNVIEMFFGNSVLATSKLPTKIHQLLRLIDIPTVKIWRDPTNLATSTLKAFVDAGSNVIEVGDAEKTFIPTCNHVTTSSMSLEKQKPKKNKNQEKRKDDSPLPWSLTNHRTKERRGRCGCREETLWRLGLEKGRLRGNAFLRHA